MLSTFKFTTAPICVVAFGLLGCSDPTANVEQADVGEAQEPATAASDSATFFALTDESKVEFTGSKVTGSHDGGFSNVTGEFAVSEGKLENTGNRIVIDMTSVWSDNNRLTGHLKNADFFDIASYPVAVFETTEVTDSGVTGNFTLHGVTKSISFTPEIDVTPESVSVRAEFAIQRFDFGIEFPGRADDLIRDGVAIRLDVSASQGRADMDAFVAAAESAADAYAAGAAPRGPRPGGSGGGGQRPGGPGGGGPGAGGPRPGGPRPNGG